MIVELENKKYYLNIKKVLEDIQSKYKGLETFVVQVGNQKIDLGKKSVLRIAVKAVVTPVILPILKDMYTKRGLELPEKIKHEDVIDYAVYNLLEFLKIAESDVIIHAESYENSTGGITNITRIHATSNTITTAIRAEKT